MQQMLLGVGAKKKTYLDDLFSTFLYKGDDTNNRNINNGIDLSGEGGMVMVRPRNNTIGINVFDTVRGASKRLFTYANSAEATDTSRLNQFNSNGFRVSSNYSTNGPNYDYTSWSFRKAKGFFDCITYTGNETNRIISHNLGCIPGLILIKCTSVASDWTVYHRALGSGKALILNNTDGEAVASNYFNDTNPTASGFTLGTRTVSNGNGRNYVAYLFAGGESTAATARSVDFDRTDDFLNTASSSDLTLGTGDFTIECFARFDQKVGQGIFQISDSTNGLEYNNRSTTLAIGHQGGGNEWLIYAGGQTRNDQITKHFSIGQWIHVAIARSSGVSKFFLNGEECVSFSDTYNYDGDKIAIGGFLNTSNLMDGSISNFRVIKGTAVYTSSFKPPTEPLTNITNTKLLCCNDSSTTGSTVTPGTITANGNPTASSDSPFDDPAGSVFGENEDQGVIKTGSYVGNGAYDGSMKIDLGWEPSFVLWKRSSGLEDWFMTDSMRGISSSGAAYMKPNATDAEASSGIIELTSTGWKILNSSNYINGSGETYIYIAIRRPDGYVGKPAELGTDVFAMDTGAGVTSLIPTFDSGFPVDFGLARRPASTESWYTGSRLTGEKTLFTDTAAGEATSSNYLLWDSNEGFWKGMATTNQAWMWKRHAGFDVVSDLGTGVGKDVVHNLNAVPEMIWRKSRDTTQNWVVYHKDLPASGSNLGFLLLQESSAAGTTSQYWTKTPTSTVFSVGNDTDVNYDTKNFSSFLFASVDGISKVGSYTGNGSTSGPTITTGFSPRFLIIKRTDGSGSWFTHDTVRGLSSGSSTSPYLRLDVNNAETSFTFGTISSTGFTLATSGSSYNASGGKYIYYAHA